jgi:hypothetical protein
MAVVEGRVAGSDKVVVKRGAAADTPPCSESMRVKFASFPISSIVEWDEVGGNSKWSSSHVGSCQKLISSPREP